MAIGGRDSAFCRGTQGRGVLVAGGSGLSGLAGDNRFFNSVSRVFIGRKGLFGDRFGLQCLSCSVWLSLRGEAFRGGQFLRRGGLLVRRRGFDCCFRGVSVWQYPATGLGLSGRARCC